MEDAVRYAIKTVTAQCVPVRMVLNLARMEEHALKVRRTYDSSTRMSWIDSLFFMFEIIT